MYLLNTLSQHNTQFADPQVLHDFMVSNFGVNTRVEGDLYLFKYNQIQANWQKPETHECRGLILRRLPSGEWAPVSRPFDKFFNLDQGHCPIFDPKSFESAISQCFLIEKADGSCIQVWHDGSQWRASTLGTITTLSVQGSAITFEQLFWEVSALDTSNLEKGYTYLFELCAKDNQNVTDYPEDHVVLIGIRKVSNGDYVSIFEDEKAQRILSSTIRLPYRYLCRELGINSQESLWSFVEEQSADSEKYGKNPEGFVVYSQDGEPLAKCKNKKYMFLHRYGGGDVGVSQQEIIKAMMNEALDDVYHDLNVRMRAFADRLQTHVAQQIQDWYGQILLLKGSYSTRKDFALAVKAKIPDSNIHSFAFGHIEAVQQGKDLDLLLDRWLKNPKIYERFMAQWKSL